MPQAMLTAPRGSGRPRLDRLFIAPLVAGWLALSFLSTGQAYASLAAQGRSVSFGSLLPWFLSLWLPWAIAAPAVFALGTRYAFGTGRRARSLALHATAACLLAGFHLSIAAAVDERLAERFEGRRLGYGRRLRVLLTGYLQSEITLYVAILGASLAVAARRQAKERALHATQLAEQLQKARLAALEAQVRPHFLFNALNTVAMLIRTDRRAEAVETTAALGDLLRRSLAHSDEVEVPLARELEFVRQYLALERLRMPDRLKPEIDVEAGALRALVPNLILQPLLENAVRHGIGGASTAGSVRVLARVQGGHLSIAVEDDGPGFAALPPREGLGLANVRKRLRELVAGGSTAPALEFGNGAQGGARVSLWLPLRHTTTEGEDRARACEATR